MKPLLDEDSLAIVELTAQLFVSENSRVSVIIDEKFNLPKGVFPLGSVGEMLTQVLIYGRTTIGHTTVDESMIQEYVTRVAIAGDRA